jgi:phosphate transport system permease protein
MRLRRIIYHRLWITFTLIAVVIAVVPLIGILADVLYLGISSINIDFFTQLPPPPCSFPTGCATGGLGNSIEGTLILVALSSALGIPIGIISGIYVTQFGNNNRYGSSIRFLGDVLAGIPSIVTGVLFFALVVIPMSGYTATAASIGLGTMMIPIVSNTSAEALRAVPNSIREASTALGIRKWRVALLMVANAKRSIATASLLAVARITGETAPLLLLAGSSSAWFSGLGHPIASLTYTIFYYGTSAYANWKSLAWGAALILIAIVMGINILVRIITRSKKGLGFV